MGYLTACAIAAPSLAIYVLMSWRIQRAYGNCGLFASRSIADLLSSKRDNVHHSPVHHLINFTRYCDTSMYVRILATVATVFCATQTMALTVVCALCLVLFFTVLARPPFQVGCMNFFALGTTATAFTANAIMLRAAWNTKDLDMLWPRLAGAAADEVLELQPPGAGGVVGGAWGGGAACRRCRAISCAGRRPRRTTSWSRRWAAGCCCSCWWRRRASSLFDWLYYSLVQPSFIADGVE